MHMKLHLYQNPLSDSAPPCIAQNKLPFTCNVRAGGLAALFSKRNIRPLLIGSSLMLFQQITGQPSVLYYAAKIFKDAGFASDADATRVSVVLGLFKLLMTGELNVWLLLVTGAKGNS